MGNDILDYSYSFIQQNYGLIPLEAQKAYCCRYSTYPLPEVTDRLKALSMLVFIPHRKLSQVAEQQSPSS